MKFLALVAAASAATDVASLAKCAAGDTCKETTECCGDVAKNSAAATGDNVDINKAAKICYDKSASTFSKKFTAQPTDEVDGWVLGSAGSVDLAKTYVGTFKCLATGAKTLAASAVLAATYYMA